MSLNPIQQAHQQALVLAAVAALLAVAAASIAWRRRVLTRAAVAFMGASGGGLIATAATLFALAHDRGLLSGGGGPTLLAFCIGCSVAPALGAALAAATRNGWPYLVAGLACLVFAVSAFYASPFSGSNAPEVGGWFATFGVAGLASICALAAALEREPAAAKRPRLGRACAILAVGIVGVAETWNLDAPGRTTRKARAAAVQPPTAREGQRTTPETAPSPLVPPPPGRAPHEPPQGIDVGGLIREAARSGGKVRFACVVPADRDLRAARRCLERLGSPLVAAGGRLFFATLTADRLPELPGCRDLFSAYAIAPEDKLDRALGQAGGAGHVLAIFFDDVTDAEADAALARAGAKRLGPTFNHAVPIAIGPDRLRALAEENVVSFIEHRVAPTVANH